MCGDGELYGGWCVDSRRLVLLFDALVSLLDTHPRILILFLVRAEHFHGDLIESTGLVQSGVYLFICPPMTDAIIDNRTLTQFFHVSFRPLHTQRN